MAKVVTVEFKADTGQFIKDVDKAEGAVDGLTEAVDETDESMDALGEVSSTVLNKIDTLTGGAVSSFIKWVGVIKGATKGFKMLKMALISSGIGALVVALGSIVAYLTQTQRGSDAVSKAFAYMGAAVDAVIDRLSSFGEGLWMIMNGDFEQGVAALQASFKGLGDEMLREGQAAVELEKARQALLVQERELSVLNVRRRAQIENLRFEAEQYDATAQESYDALAKAAAIQNKMTDDAIALAKEKLRIQTEQNALGESMNEDLDEEARLKIELISLETERDATLKRLTTRQAAFRREIEATNEANKESILILNKKNADLTEGTDKATEAALNKTVQTQKMILKTEEDNSGLRLNVAQATAAATQSILEEGSDAAKGVAIAQALLSAYQAINNALASVPAPFNFAMAAATGVMAFAQISKMLQVDSSGSNASSIASGGSTSIAAPAPQVTINAANGYQNQVQDASDQPLRAYVVSNDVTTQQALGRRISNTAQFG